MVPAAYTDSATLDELALSAVVGFAVFGWVALPVALRSRSVGQVVAAAVPVLLSVLVVIAIFTADWQ